VLAWPSFQDRARFPLRVRSRRSYVVPDSKYHQVLPRSFFLLPPDLDHPPAALGLSPLPEELG
jgi:hypothetical protein